MPGRFCVMRYLLDHWRGRHSLVRSFWLNGLAANVAAVAFLTAMTLVVAGPAKDSPPAMLAGLLVMWGGAVALTVWQVVGTWRAADAHCRTGRGRLWGRVAQLALLALVLRAAATLYDGGLQIGHLTRLVLGRDGLTTSVARDGEAVLVSGSITFATPGKLQRLLESPDAPRRVRFDSPGGYVGPAQRLRELIERSGAETEVVGRCESACTLAFIAGSQRLAGPGTRFGFHGFSLPGVPRAEIAAEEERVKLAWRRRGVDADFIDHAFAGTEMWLPSLEELAAANFVTHVAADGKVTDARAYCLEHDCR